LTRNERLLDNLPRNRHRLFNYQRDNSELAAQADQLGSAREVFRLVNARLFLGFRPVKVKKRVLNKVTGGVVTFGEAPPPIEIYQGPTARRKIKGPAASDAAGPGGRCSPTPPERSIDSGREGKSLGNVNRGDSRCTFVNETDGLWLVLTLFPQVLEFPGDAVLKYVEPGLYSKRR